MKIADFRGKTTHGCKMTTHYDASNYQHKLPHVPFGRALKKAYLQQERTISALQAQMHMEQTKAANIHSERDTQSKSVEIENLKNECEDKEKEALKLKEQAVSLQDKQTEIEKKNIEMIEGMKGKAIELEKKSATLEEDLKESNITMDSMKKQRSEVECKHLQKEKEADDMKEEIAKKNEKMRFLNTTLESEEKKSKNFNLR